MSNNTNKPASPQPANRSPRFGSAMVFYLVLIVLLVVFSAMMFGDRTMGRDQTTLSDVMEIIENRDLTVNKVDVNGTSVTIEYKDLSGLNQTLTQRVPYEYVDDLIAKLDEYKSQGYIDDYNYTEPVDWATIINGLSLIGLVVVAAVIFINFNRQTKDSNSVFSFGSNRARLTNPNEIKLKFTDVAGSVEEKEELSEVVDFLKSPKKYK